MKKLLQTLLCKIGWHSIFIGFDKLEHDGCSQHAKCKWCGYRGMIDSQGNLFLVFLLLLLTNSTYALPIFPGAEGFGTDTVAGSGRGSAQAVIYKVNNLNNSGAGSLRECMEATTPRTCVFEIGGVIWLQNAITVNNPNLSVFGETAPHPGIVLRGSGLIIQASDVAIRHIKVRPGDDPRDPCCKAGTCSASVQLTCTQDPGSRDGINVSTYTATKPINNVVIDHVSITWALDEGFSISPSKFDISNVTFSNSIVAHGLEDSIHPDNIAAKEACASGGSCKDLGHSKGTLISGGKKVDKLSYIKNLLAHNMDRNIRASTPVNMQFINNYVYDWGRGGGAGHTIELTNSLSAIFIFDIIGNIYKPGVESFCPGLLYQPSRCVNVTDNPLKMSYMLKHGKSQGLTNQSRFYVFDNISNTRPNSTTSDWDIVDTIMFKDSSRTQLTYPENKATSPIYSGINILPSDSVSSYVLSNAGAFPTNRDLIDAAIIDDVQNNRGNAINCVYPDGTQRCEKNAGGWQYDGQTNRPFIVPDNPFAIDSNGYTKLENAIFFSSELPDETPTPISTPTITPTPEPSPTVAMCWLPCPTNTPIVTSTPTKSPTKTPTITPTATNTIALGTCEAWVNACVVKCEDCGRYLQNKISAYPHPPGTTCTEEVRVCKILCEDCK